MESFRQGYRLNDGDLEVQFWAQGLTYPSGLSFLYSPYSVSYEISYYHPTEARYITIGPRNRRPINIKIGIYRATFIVGEHWTPGTYKITWKYYVSEVSSEQIKEEEFEIVSRGVDSVIFEVFYCQRNVGGRVLIWQESYDLPAEFVVLPSYFDLSASFAIIP